MKTRVAFVFIIAIMGMTTYYAYGQQPNSNSNSNSTTNLTEIIETHNTAVDNYNILDDLTDICKQYIELEALEQEERCTAVFQEFNTYMEQLQNNHNDTINEFTAIANRSGY